MAKSTSLHDLSFTHPSTIFHVRLRERANFDTNHLNRCDACGPRVQLSLSVMFWWRDLGWNRVVLLFTLRLRWHEHECIPFCPLDLSAQRTF